MNIFRNQRITIRDKNGIPVVTRLIIEINGTYIRQLRCLEQNVPPQHRNLPER